MVAMFMIADVVSRRERAREVGFHDFPRFTLGGSKDDLDPILFEEAHRTRSHATCYDRGHTLFRQPSRQKAGLVSRRRDEFTRHNRIGGVIDIEHGERLAMPEVRREPAAGYR